MEDQATKIDAGRKNSLFREGSSFWRQGAFIALNKEQWCVAWGESQWAESPDNTGFSFYLPDFFLEKKLCWLNFPKGEIVSPSEVLTALQLAHKDPARHKFKWKLPEKSSFRSQFVTVLDKIQQGEYEKAVPVVFSEAIGSFDDSFKRQCLLALCTESHSNPFGFWRGDEGMVGATPERLFQLDRQELTLTTMALAGTGTLQQNLIDNSKERHEHSVVVDEVVERLSQLGEVKSSETYEWSIKYLKHLRTDINLVNAPMLTMEQWVSYLHPTPALGVAPRSRGWRWLEKLNYQEDKNRPRRHGAPFGVKLPSGDIHCLVSIRQIQWLDHVAYLGVGCGVVVESDIDREWEELQLKRSAIQGALQL